jgi:hypothetical protein
MGGCGEARHIDADLRHHDLRGFRPPLTPYCVRTYIPLKTFLARVCQVRIRWD